MAYNNEQVQDLLNAAADDDMRFVVGSDGEVDYKGRDARKALDAILELEEAAVSFYDAYGDYAGWALILPDLEEGEQIADCTGWVSVWCDAN